MTLDELATSYGTDKGPSGHWYTRYYDKIFGDTRLNVESVCEVGIGSGASLKMWRDYFPNALIHGVDMNQQGDMGERIHCYVIEQTHCHGLMEYLGSKNIEIIIDDASHDQDKTWKTFECLWRIVPPKGWYVIEDMDKTWFPSTIGEWCGKHQSEVRQLFLIDSNYHGCLICFIQKR